MKKLLYTAVAGLLIGQVAMAQPVSDRAVIPVAVSLNRVLRLNVNDGGNVEFVFNTIGQYNLGIANGVSGFYDTDFTVASSTNWRIVMGAEDANLLGTDNNIANTIALDNVGYLIVSNGTASCCAAANDIEDPAGATGPATVANGLAQYVGGVGGPIILTSGVAQNAGDVVANSFEINWECGTLIVAGATPMNAVSLLNQSITPDRYITNVLLDLDAL